MAMAALVVSAAVSAQESGSLRGSVFDRDFDVPISAAQVVIIETGQRVETNEQGTFVFSQLRPGKYTIVVSRDGYVRQVRADLVVAGGQLTDVSVTLTGDFTDMDEFVVRDPLRLGAEGEPALLDLRLESPAFLNTISADMMSKSGYSDAAGALRLVSGASLQDGKTAVIRGLPDRYVSSQMNGVRLPSADEDRRAVELDQFPSSVISSINVSKTFTPDQLGDASGGAVDVRLRGIPDKPLFATYSLQTSHNTQVTGRSRFLGYDGGGLDYFGGAASSRGPQEVGENWTGAVGVSEIDAPIDYKWTGAFGGKFEVSKGLRFGGFASVFYERDSSFYDNGVDDSWNVTTLGDPPQPATNGSPSLGEFTTSLLDVTQGKQSVQWGGLGTIGVETDDHAIGLVYLFTRTSEDVATLAEDTRGKAYFYPDYDRNDPATPGQGQLAPYLRLQTLEYTERVTETLQLSGKHRLGFLSTTRQAPAVLEWTVAQSSADRDQPDKRLFTEKWIPNEYQALKPAASFNLGNLQRTYKTLAEESDQYTASLKIPFTQWGNEKGYVKFGAFSDKVDRTYEQETFSNFADPLSTTPGDWDGLDWSDSWAFQDHPITPGPFDVDYAGEQDVTATFLMMELPLSKSTKLLGGVRWESTKTTVINDPDPQAQWVPEGSFAPETLLPGAADVDFQQDDVLPSIGVNHEPLQGLTLRAAYSETVARQTFKELTPILNQEYVGGPVFVGNPSLEMSNVRNYDLRADYTTRQGGFFSASWFQKDIENPIEYVEKATTFNYTTPVNYPRGELKGYELEARQEFGAYVEELDGIEFGGNLTQLDAKVRLPDDEILQFQGLSGVRPSGTRDMTSAPDYLWNLFLTYDIDLTRTQFGLFYTVQGDTLVQGSGPSNSFYIPPTYLLKFDTLNFTATQWLTDHVRLTFQAKNLTDAPQTEVYRSEYIPTDVLRRTYTSGIEFSLTIGGEIRF
jgi:TonB-dependent receptor